jgi:hypothetical protein
LQPGGPQGPERLLGTSECDGCEDTTETVAALTGTPAPSPSAGRSGDAGRLEPGGPLG